MKNKILVQVVVPDIEEEYNVFIPVNKKVGNVAILLSKAIQEMTNNIYVENNKNGIYNSDTGELLPTDAMIRETSIRNGSRIILM